MTNELTRIVHMFHNTMNIYVDHITACPLCRRNQPCEMQEKITDLAQQITQRSFALQVEQLKAYENRATK